MSTEHDASQTEARPRPGPAPEAAPDACEKTVPDDPAVAPGGPAVAPGDPAVLAGLLDHQVVHRLLRGRDRPSGPAPPPPEPERPEAEEPPVIDGYEILAQIGSGGMGSVWKARQTSLDRVVAVKILPQLFAHNAKLIERFRREALATAQLNHPNIVAAIDVGCQQRPGEPDLHYFVMEYVDGESVDDIIAAAGKISATQAADITIAMAGALDYAWEEARIVHRDVKPGNILITRNGAVKLLDLGLARNMSESAHLTTAGLALGTPHYASPEQCQGKESVDVRTDIYGLGATLFHMLTGRTVFLGDSAAAVMAKHVSEDAPACRAVNPRISRELAAVVAKMLQRDPAKRYQTHRELIAELGRIKRGDRPLAYTRMLAAHEGTFSGARLPRILTPGAVPARRRTRRGSGRRQWPHALGALLLVAGLGYAVWHTVDGLPRSGTRARRGAKGADDDSGTPAPGAFVKGVDVWFRVSDPHHDMGRHAAFPPGFSSRSTVRYFVKPRRFACIYVIRITNGDTVGSVRLSLRVPERTTGGLVYTNQLGEFPRGDAFDTLPRTTHTVAFIAVASQTGIARAQVVKELGRISNELSGAAGLSAQVPGGETLWYGETAAEWCTRSGRPAAGDAVRVLDEACSKVRAVFETESGWVSLCGAATSFPLSPAR